MAAQQVQDPSAAQAEPQDDGGYTIEIDVTSDGQISVSVETDGQEDAEQQGGGEDEGNAMPAKNIKDALTIALAIFKANGQMPAPDTSDSDFNEGFGGNG